MSFPDSWYSAAHVSTDNDVIAIFIVTSNSLTSSCPTVTHLGVYFGSAGRHQQTHGVGAARLRASC